MASCTPLMLKHMGTDYSFNGHTSKEQIYKVFGEPLSEHLFDIPLDAESIPELKNHAYPIHNKKVIASEVFKIKGHARTSDEMEGADYLLVIDVCTLGLAEIVFFPLTVTSYIMDSMTEKKVTIWYNEDMECAYGEINSINEKRSTIPIRCY
jgi:hypothetical protein